MHDCINSSETPDVIIDEGGESVPCIPVDFGQLIEKAKSVAKVRAAAFPGSVTRQMASFAQELETAARMLKKNEEMEGQLLPMLGAKYQALPRHLSLVGISDETMVLIFSDTVLEACNAIVQTRPALRLIK